MLPLPSGSDSSFSSLPIRESSQVGDARRIASTLARKLGFSETEISNVAILITEVAGNLLKHASEGELLVRAVGVGDGSLIEVLALDKGPGMKDVARCLEDGFSTAGSPGTGLGAIRRLSSLFEIYSLPQSGTALLAQIWSPSILSPNDRKLEFGVVNVPKTGEPVCGDAWEVQQSADGGRILIADGLGHGIGAMEAAKEAVRIFQTYGECDLPSMIQKIHTALRGTRGAAVAVAAVNLPDRTLRFCGVGNIGGTILRGAETRSLVSHNGTAGHALHKVQEFIYPFPKDALLVMYSDGLQSRWQLDPYPGLAAQHPSLIAGVLYRDFNRGRDDVTVLVARANCD